MKGHVFRSWKKGVWATHDVVRPYSINITEEILEPPHTCKLCHLEIHGVLEIMERMRNHFTELVPPPAANLEHRDPAPLR